MKSCFLPANIYLPNQEVDMSTWSVIACDQYTSQPAYWERVEGLVKDAASTYNIIYPEVYLGEQKERIGKIYEMMRQYLKEGILTEEVREGFILTVRQTGQTMRAGLIGKLDLEQYDYEPGNKAAVRATEGTILSRIPPRVDIRKGAALECPHVMVLLKDEYERLIEPLYAERGCLRKVYEFELMMGGGHIEGFAVEGKKARSIADIVADMQKREEFLFAVGDGNHSLAAAKAYWTELREWISPEERAWHPARYALVEVVNLYSPAIVFEPIHRVLFHASEKELIDALESGLERQGISLSCGRDITIVNAKEEKNIGFDGLKGRLPVDVLQKVLDELLITNPSVSIDYIHGADNVSMLAAQGKDTIGILLNGMKKESVFPAIEAGGVLPRKTFSMGEADEKRFYLECRSLQFQREQ